MLLVLLGSHLFPLREGRALGSLVWQVVAAPMYPIDLRSVLVGDVLTSMVKPLQVPVPHATRHTPSQCARCTPRAPLSAPPCLLWFPL